MVQLNKLFCLAVICITNLGDTLATELEDQSNKVNEGASHEDATKNDEVHHGEAVTKEYMERVATIQAVIFAYLQGNGDSLGKELEDLLNKVNEEASNKDSIKNDSDRTSGTATKTSIKKKSMLQAFVSIYLKGLEVRLGMELNDQFKKPNKDGINNDVDQPGETASKGYKERLATIRAVISSYLRGNDDSLGKELEYLLNKLNEKISNEDGKKNEVCKSCGTSKTSIRAISILRAFIAVYLKGYEDKLGRDLEAQLNNLIHKESHKDGVKNEVCKTCGTSKASVKELSILRAFISIYLKGFREKLGNDLEAQLNDEIAKSNKGNDSKKEDNK